MKTRCINSLLVWKSIRKKTRGSNFPNRSKRPNPLIIGELVVVSCYVSKAVYCFNKKNGRLIWKFQLQDHGAGPLSFTKKFIFAHTFHKVFCLRVKDGSLMWEYSSLDKNGITGKFYSEAEIGKEKIFVGDSLGNLHCVCMESGELIWKKKLIKNEREIDATPLRIKNKIFVNNSHGDVGAFTEEGEKLWRVRLPGSRGRAMRPIFFNKALFIVRKNALHALSLEGEKKFSLKFSNLIDVIFHKGKMYCIEVRSRKKDENPMESPHFIICYSSYFEKIYEVKLHGAPDNIMPTADPDCLALGGFNSLDFFNIEMRKVEFSIPGYLTGFFSFESNCFYMSTPTYEVSCLRVPKNKEK